MAEPLRATFYTLKKHGPHSGVLLGATLTTAALVLLIVGAFVALCYPMFAPLFAANAPQSVDALGTFFSLFGLIFLLIFALYILFAAYEAACLRWMIRQEAPGWFGLALGADTWRVYGGYWLWLLIYLGVSTAVSMVMMPIMFMVIIPNMQTGATPDMGAVLGMQLGVNGLFYIVMAFIGVRFAPAAATSIARRRFAFFDAWIVTKGRFWELLLSFFILMLGYVAAFSLLMAYLFGTMFKGRLPSATASPEELQATLAAILAPQNLAIIGALYLLMFAVGIFYVVFSYGVNARAVIAAIDDGKIQGQTPNVAQVFE